MRFLKVVARITAVSALFVALPAAASLLTYTDTYTGRSATTGGFTRVFPNEETGPRASPFTATFSFTELNPLVLPGFTVAGFDNDLGTLTAVTIDYLRTGEGAALPSEMFVRALCFDEADDVCSTAGSNSEVGVAYGFYNQTLNDIVPTAFNYQRESPSPFGYAFTPTNLTAAIAYGDPADLAAFSAGDLLFRPVAGVDIENVLSCQSDTGTISFCRVMSDVRINQAYRIDVRYTYEPSTPVPLPGGAPLFLAGFLAGLALLARRHRSALSSY